MLTVLRNSRNLLVIYVLKILANIAPRTLKYLLNAIEGPVLLGIDRHLHYFQFLQPDGYGRHKK